MDNVVKTLRGLSPASLPGSDSTAALLADIFPSSMGTEMFRCEAGKPWQISP